MEKLIKTILTNNSFYYNEEINGFHDSDKSYFFIKTLSASQLEELKNKNSLNTASWYQDFLSQFNNKCESPKYPALEKNSSLILLIDTFDITDIERLQTQIMLIEEDQFYLKKYVIMYTAIAVRKLEGVESNEQLQLAVNNKTHFRNIFENGFTKESDYYILILQLFIKLPFLKLHFTEGDFITLSEKLINILGNNHKIFKNFLAVKEKYKEIDFLELESENEIDNLITLLANDKN